MNIFLALSFGGGFRPPYDSAYNAHLYPELYPYFLSITAVIGIVAGIKVIQIMLRKRRNRLINKKSE